jgi:hypothetical protein
MNAMGRKPTAQPVAREATLAQVGTLLVGTDMAKRESWLKKIDNARVGNWIESIGGPRPLESLEEVLDPGLKQVSRFTDDELAEVIGREPTSKLGLLAARVQRQRESWSTPAKWSLFVALCSLAVALAALARTM